MQHTFTAVYIEAEDGWFVAYIEELHGTHTQGRTIEEARERLREIVEMTLDDTRAANREVYAGYRVALRERFLVGR
jgi:predicted RNase H-like HicB family nuclease